MTQELWFDTDSNPQTLYARVGAAWVPIVGTDEMWIGPNDPFIADPTGLYELWYDEDATPPTLFVRVGGAWVPASVAIDEVWIGNADPYATDPLGTWEVWYNTGVTPGILLIRVTGAWVPASTSIDEVWIDPAQPVDPQVELWFDISQTPPVLMARVGGVWVPVVGNGLPPGGTTGQHLTKRSDFDYDAEWTDEAVTAWATVLTTEYDYDQVPFIGVLDEMARADHTHGTPHAEVAVGIEDPYIGTPLGSYEWWYNPTVPGVVNVREPGGPTGVWVPVSLSSFAPPTQDISMGDQFVTDVQGPPVNDTDAVNKAYVDDLINGLSWKEAVVAASAPGENVDLVLGGLVPLDGVTPGAGDRVLVKDQTLPAQNGIYLASAATWVRTVDADDADGLANAAVYVPAGLTQSDSTWVSQSDDTLVIEVDPVIWVQFSTGTIPLGTSVAGLEPGKVPTAGTSAAASAEDHVHYMPPWGGVKTATAYALPPLAGVLDYFARADHEHGTVPRELPPGGVAGDALVKIDGTDYAVEWTAAVGGITVEHEVYVQPTDPMPADPLVELWYIPNSAPPPTPPALWDATASYQTGDWCQWPTAAEHWRTSRPTIGEEPGTTLPAPPADGVLFPGGGAVISGLQAAAPAGLDVSAGFDLRVRTDGTLGIGDIILINGAVKLNASPGTLTASVVSVGGWLDFPEAVPAARWHRVLHDGTGIQQFASADGVNWTASSPERVCPVPDAPAGNIYIGNGGASNTSYAGVLQAVQTYNAAGAALMQSWDRPVQPDEFGTGTSPTTGETYSVYPGSLDLVDVGGGTATPNPWFAVPAPPAAATPGVLRANVLGVWEDVATGAGADEVHVGPDDPTLVIPTAELWYDTDDVQQTVDGYLPLAGGTMEADAVIQFQNEADVPKINYYGDTFGVGIEGGTQTIFASSRVRFRVGTPVDPARGGITSPTVAEIDANCAGGRVVTTNSYGMRKQDNLAIVAGSYYRVRQLPYRYNSIWRLVVAASSPGNAQRFEACVWCDMNAGDAQVSLIGDQFLRGTKLFDRITVNYHGGGGLLKLRAVASLTLTNIGWTLPDETEAILDDSNATIALDTSGGNEYGAVDL